MIKLFIHPVTVITKDYGDNLSIEHGISVSGDNEWHPGRFERGKTVDAEIARYVRTCEEHGAEHEIRPGKPIKLTTDINHILEVFQLPDLRLCRSRLILYLGSKPPA